MSSRTNTKTCGISGCQRPYQSIGYCGTHAYRVRNGLDIEAPIGSLPKRKSSPRKDCSVSDCDRPSKSYGLCDTHRKQVQKYGLAEPRRITPTVRKTGKCAVLECIEPDHTSGYCGIHYDQHRRGRDFQPRQRYRYSSSQKCVIAQCDKKIVGGNLLCNTHAAICYQYKLTSIQIEMTWGRGCEICGSGDRLHIDHDHSCCPVGSKNQCGECVRGCLCNDCNLALGFLRDDIDRLKSAIAYLSR